MQRLRLLGVATLMSLKLSHVSTVYVQLYIILAYLLYIPVHLGIVD